jgi:hypothetical protein
MHPTEEMLHARVAHNDKLVDIPATASDFFHAVSYQVIDIVGYHALERIESFFMF